MLYRDTWAAVDLQAVYDNVHAFKQHLLPHQQLMAVVKADGYGHGAIRIAETAVRAGATWLAVALLEEAIELREAGFTLPILVLGYVPARGVRVAQQYRISVMVNDAEHFGIVCSAVDEKLPPLAFHLKVDTGMSRLGVYGVEQYEQLIHAYLDAQRSPVIWEGLYTHLATADEEDETALKKQLAVMNDRIQRLKDHGLHVPCVHISNSAGTIKRLTYPYSNLVRIGISMYGLAPSPYMHSTLPFPLKPAFSLHSRLAQVKKIRPGEGVSYGLTYCAEQEEWIGTIPIGYGDGLSRNLSNRAEVLIGGKRMPIIGRICMDLTMIRLDKQYPRGEKVTLIGWQGNEEVSADEMAERLETINYEIPCMITARVPRLYS